MWSFVQTFFTNNKTFLWLIIFVIFCLLIFSFSIQCTSQSPYTYSLLSFLPSFFPSSSLHSIIPSFYIYIFFSSSLSLFPSSSSFFKPLFSCLSLSFFPLSLHIIFSSLSLCYLSSRLSHFYSCPFLLHFIPCCPS